MKRILALLLLGAWVCAPIFSTCAAAQPQDSSENAIVATVGGEPIRAAEVEKMLQKATGGRKVNPAVLPWMRARVLAGIVDRRLVLAYARRTKTGAVPPEIDTAVAALKSKLEAQKSSLEKFLEERSMTEAELRREFEWDLTWKKFLARYLTDERLASYFNTHRREFDGTQISVSHILLRPKAGAGPQATAALVQQAQTIRREITSGKITFADAAKKYSTGPSRTAGGRLGFIARHGSMPERFSRAAFALDTGQISEPVQTQSGIHLIRCNEIKPGAKKPGEVREQLDAALAKELMKKLADLQRPHAPVTFTGAAPHFKPGTQELVVP